MTDLPINSYRHSHDLPIPINIICCYRRIEDITCAPDPSTNHPGALKPLLISLGLLFVISSMPL